MISEGSCDTEDCFASTGINYILKYTEMYYYYFFLIVKYFTILLFLLNFDQINAALLSIRIILLTQNFWIVVYVLFIIKKLIL